MTVNKKKSSKPYPRRGIFFNSEFLSYTDEEKRHQQTENENTQHTQEEENSNETHITQTSENVPWRLHNKKFSARGILAFLLIALIITATLGTLMWSKQSTKFLVDNENNNEELKIKYIPLPGVNYIKFGYLYDAETDALGTKTFEKNGHPLALRLDKLLAENRSTMKIYVHPEMNRLSVDFTITNRCHRAWQVLLTIHHWQHDSKKLNNYIYQNVERTLHEMPPCE